MHNKSNQERSIIKTKISGKAAECACLNKLKSKVHILF
ncbi:MAG: hypothetical protein AVDCRST_MAG95-1614 [uncultured Adhaeribacter sp.]|uniref:Uncharacterized protein n=1 Tax=uncultured Adhaeribacter sp. TaxID=448109 RepID=A0A6J4IB89_9BACT|nr:MAG: hypothetical protein AVDCRST_MAG95-1614 [uncultured Adhaeribacter sp.]